MDYKNLLNTRQYEAVTTEKQYVRVVAGAGSGKTRVLTYRIAYLLDKFNVQPWEILAITFTNKVASEMKERITNLVPTSNRDLTIKTFHSFAAMFLRREIQAIGFPKTFTILDEEDQEKIIKDIAHENGYKRSDPIVKRTLGFIGSRKLKEQYPIDISRDKLLNYDDKICLDFYTRYEEEKDKMFALDFDDLLLKTNFILSNFPDVRFRWQNKYLHILVDEFQDTNDVEFKLLNLLMDRDTNLYVVGDPDQTIYTWRGANQDIILQLQKRYPLIEDIVLDRNYRSTQTILNAANKLIANNKMRLAKNLYTENNAGSPITVRSCPTSRSEADYLVRQVKILHDVEKRPYKDIVVLYRSNYITQEFEQAFTKNRIPYKIYGGLKFYQRKEIKDVLAYFRLISNRLDDLAFERIINVPKRNIGETSLKIIKSEAKDAGLSIYDYLTQVNNSDTQLSTKNVTTLKSLIYRIDKARNDIIENDEMFSKHLEDLIIDIGYYDYIVTEEEGESRLDNVKALFEDIRHYIKTNPESSFDEYLQNIALVSAQDELLDGDFVTFMTVHTAKGLEFPIVFLIRLNETVFPNARAMNESGYKGLEEERRLCYVAITRAKEKLYISCANDYSYVSQGMLIPSKFIKESGLSTPVESNSNRQSSYGGYSGSYNFNQTRPTRSLFDDTPSQPSKPSVSQTINLNKSNNINWSVGDVCIHKKFGKGTVTEVEGDGVITVNFPEHGNKTLMGNHPALSKGGFDA